MNFVFTILNSQRPVAAQRIDSRFLLERVVRGSGLTVCQVERMQAGVQSNGLGDVPSPLISCLGASDKA